MRTRPAARLESPAASTPPRRPTVLGGLALAVLLVGGAAPAGAVSRYLADFRAQYEGVAGTRLDTCGVCHGAVPQLNDYGRAFADAGEAFAPIEPLDSDGDGASNLTEILALTFPGNAADAPPQVTPTPTATPLPTATSGPGGCAGDCAGDGAVTVDDLLKAVNVALGTSPVTLCTAADGNGDGAVTINELLAAVNRALDGCG